MMTRPSTHSKSWHVNRLSFVDVIGDALVVDDNSRHNLSQFSLMVW